MRLQNLHRPPTRGARTRSTSPIPDEANEGAFEPAELEAAEELEDAIAAAETGAEPSLHDPPLQPRDEAVFLLHAAAEVEHALMAQYLFAAYSLKEDLDALGAPAEAESWRRDLLQIAREEMAHLMTVQNLLRLVGGPLNFEREDLPFRSEIYPFRFKLEPLTKGSLAKYVCAEMPAALDDPEDPDEAEQIRRIKQRAKEANNGEDVRHVGWLYDRLVRIFEAIDPEVHLRPGIIFRTEVVPYWGAPAHWAIGLNRERLLVLPKAESATDLQSLKEAAIDALRAVAAQGEGHPSSSERSHYDVFRGIYDAFPDFGDEIPPWRLAIAANPNTVDPDAEVDEETARGRILDPRTRAWAQLFNLRYRLLLSYLSHFLLLDYPLSNESGQVTMRGKLRLWTFGEMRRLSMIAGRLGELPSPAGAPFELPYTLALSDYEPNRWWEHRDITLAAKRLIEERLHGEGYDLDDAVLASILSSDAADRVDMENAARGQTTPGDPAPDPVPPPVPTPLGFAANIRRLFRTSDVGCMQGYGIDLSDYESVKANAELIYSRLKPGGGMPPDGPLPANQIADFRAWIDGGTKP
jgi:hypothetical protein